MKSNRITKLFAIPYPIIQGGMVWNSGWRLASAVSNAGGLGLIGAGSMYPDVLQEHITKCKKATNNSFGVNVPLLYPNIDDIMQIIVKEDIKIVFTSAGNPKTWTNWLKERGIKVVHVVSSVKFAKKSEEAGVDAIVAEGFEAGGHNGREETTTFCLIPDVVENVRIPVIAAGGIAKGSQILATEVLGAAGVQIGSRFAATLEGSAHARFKSEIVSAKEGDTELVMKSLTPVRLLKNDFYKQIKEAEKSGARPEDLKALLGRGRAKKGMLEGNLLEGELEIGQSSALIDDVLPVAKVFENLLKEYQESYQKLCQQSL